MRKKLLSACIVAALGGGFAAAALAQVKPETLVKQRQAAMTLQGKYFGPLVGMLKGNIPYDAAIVTRNAGFLDDLSQMPWDGFTDATKGVKTPPCRRSGPSQRSSSRPRTSSAPRSSR